MANEDNEFNKDSGGMYAKYCSHQKLKKVL